MIRRHVSELNNQTEQTPVPERTQVGLVSAKQLRQTAHLSAPELRVCEQLVYGRRNNQIARRLRLAENTVKSHLQRAFVKLGAHSREQIVVFLYESGLVQPDYAVSDAVGADQERWAPAGSATAKRARLSASPCRENDHVPPVPLLYRF